MTLMLTPFSLPLSERPDTPHPGASIYWFGLGGLVIAIDPYFSPSLGKKCRGKRHAHERLMPGPATPADIGPVDLVLISHHHTDNMAPETLAPRASLAATRERIGVADERLIGVEADEQFSALKDHSINAVPANAIDAKSGAGDCGTQVHRAKLSVEYRLAN